MEGAGYQGLAMKEIAVNQDDMRVKVSLKNITGTLDTLDGTINAMFRVTVFWNVKPDEATKDQLMSLKGLRDWSKEKRDSSWPTHPDDVSKGIKIWVPPMSILNSVSFEMANPNQGVEVHCIDPEKGLMRKTMLYRAILTQDMENICNFPHDVYLLKIELGVTYGKGEEMSIGFATMEDNRSQNRLMNPNGDLDDSITLPGFTRANHLTFHTEKKICDANAKGDMWVVNLKVARNSVYYDTNIIPIVLATNVAALMALAEPAAEVNNRLQIILAVAFLEVGFRFTIDSKLPEVNCQIKLQSFLNSFFYMLIMLALEGCILYLLTERLQVVETKIADYVDIVFASVFALYSAVQGGTVYYEGQQHKKEIVDVDRD